MVKKVVVCVMLATVAALAWQGLTSVPAGADEEAGSLLTWGKDSVWGLFPDTINIRTHAGYLEPLKPSFRRIAQIPSGPGAADGRVVCCDSDHDSLPELIFYNGGRGYGDPFRIEIWELSHAMGNEFHLARADTGTTPPQEPPNGITTGNSMPFAAGDVDGDGLTDIVCTGMFYDPETARAVIMTLESPDLHSFPSRVSWYYKGPDNYVPFSPVHIAHNLDGDGRNEIIGWLNYVGTCTWKNIGNDSNALVWSEYWGTSYLALGNFCGDGKLSIAENAFVAEVWESNGLNQYELMYKDTLDLVNGWDVFTTNDIDGDGRAEFYVSVFNYPRARMYLYMYEDEGDGRSFTHTLVDTLKYMGNDDWGRASAGGDIDGDGIDECIWTTYDSVRVYKAYGNNDLRRVWDWRNDHHDTSGFNALTTTVYDVNGDGYNELILGGNHKISIFEVDAVDLLSPNGGSCSVGDTVLIRWDTHAPPRCDSLSLFLRCDSLWHLQTIATGLPGTDTLYRWIVPSGVPDSGRIVVMAYGPGHEWDMSDSVITFIGGGVAEGTHSVPLQWSLSVSPNPARGAFSVRFDVPRQSRVSVGVYDADGRLVRSLSDGEVSPGRYETRLRSGALPAGIYFLRLDTPGFRDVKKAVVTR